MKKIRLEINALDMERPKKRWELYFVIATEDPKNSVNTLISIAPYDAFIQYQKSTETYYSFKTDDPISDGMLILERNMPKDKQIRVRLWLIHSRDKVESTQDVLQKVNNAIEGKILPITQNILGENPWISVSGYGMDIIAGVLKDSKDKQMGIVDLDENFNTGIKGRIDRSGEISTGFGAIEWSWIII